MAIKVQWSDDRIDAYVEMDGYALPRSFRLEATYAENDPELALAFRVVGQRVECSGLEIRSSDAAREITAGDLRAVRLGDLMETAVHLAARPVSSGTSTDGVHAIAIRAFDAEDRGAVRAANQGRQRVNEATLRQVAEVARSADKPVDAVMEAMGVQRRAAQLWLKRARDGGYMSKDG